MKKTLGRLVERLTAKLGAERSSEIDSDKKAEVEASRRGFLKGVLGVLATSGLTACVGAFSKLDQNFDLSEVEPLPIKGPVVEVENLTDSEQYKIMEREWNNKSLLISPKSLIELPSSAEKKWKWKFGEQKIREIFMKAGYQIMGTPIINECLSVSVKDKEGKYVALYFQGDENYIELVLGAWDKNEKPLGELHFQMKPPETAPFVRMYENFGEKAATIHSIAFPEGTVHSDSVSEKIHLTIGEFTVDSKTKVMELLQKCKCSYDFITILSAAPIEFLKPQNFEELTTLISLLPSNDPLYFSSLLIDRLVQYKKDENSSQEYKAPMQTILDGLGDCDDYTMLNALWGKLNGFMVVLHVWLDGINGRDDHVTAVITNPGTGESFFCDNTNVYRGKDVEKTLDNYRNVYSSEEITSV